MGVDKMVQELSRQNRSRQNGSNFVWASDLTDWAGNGLGNNLAYICLEQCNATVSVGEGKNTTSANQL